jgi:hypothetical protein
VSSRPPSRDVRGDKLVGTPTPLDRDRDRMGDRERMGERDGGSASAKSKLPKARSVRLGEVVGKRREEENMSPGFGGGGSGSGSASGGGSGSGGGSASSTSSTPLPRLQIARRRRDTSGGEMQIFRRGSRVKLEE